MDRKIRQLVITGATSGIGKQTTIEFAKKGWDICLVSRSELKLKSFANQLAMDYPSIRIQYLPLDLSSIEAVKSAESWFDTHLDHVDLLINNAGAIFGDLSYTTEGLEKTFALNHMGYFTITHILLKVLMRGSDPQIINVASVAHTFLKKVNWDDIYFEKRSYKQLIVYGQSKLFNIYFTMYLAEQLLGKIRVNTLHPGTIRTGFGQSGSPFFSKLVRIGAPFLSKPQKASSAILHIATVEADKGVSGVYYDKARRGKLSKLAHNKENRETLWTLSENMSGINNYFKDVKM